MRFNIWPLKGPIFYYIGTFLFNHLVFCKKCACFIDLYEQIEVSVGWNTVFIAQMCQISTLTILMGPTFHKMSWTYTDFILVKAHAHNLAPLFYSQKVFFFIELYFHVQNLASLPPLWENCRWDDPWASTQIKGYLQLSEINKGHEVRLKVLFIYHHPNVKYHYIHTYATSTYQMFCNLSFWVLTSPFIQTKIRNVLRIVTLTFVIVFFSFWQTLKICHFILAPYRVLTNRFNPAIPQKPSSSQWPYR